MTATDPTEIIEIDREAKELADRGGSRPNLDWRYASLFGAVAVFLLVRGLDAILLADRNLALWPALILTVLCSAGAGGVQRWREQSWLARYTQAWVEIMARARSSSH